MQVKVFQVRFSEPDVMEKSINSFYSEMAKKGIKCKQPDIACSDHYLYAVISYEEKENDRKEGK